MRFVSFCRRAFVASYLMSIFHLVKEKIVEKVNYYIILKSATNRIRIINVHEKIISHAIEKKQNCR